MSLIILTSFCEGQMGGNRSEEIRILKMLCCPVPNVISNSTHAEIWHWEGVQKDTLIPTPDTTLRKLLIAGEERNNLKKQVRNLEEQIKLLNDVIKEQVSKGELQNEFHQNQMNNLKDQLVIAKGIADEFEKEMKRERRKRRLVTAGGILTTGAALFLTLKK